MLSAGTLESYGYRFVTQDGVIVVSETPCRWLPKKRARHFAARVEYTAGIRCREEKWQKYHRRVPPSTTLPPLLHRRSPKLLVTTHRIYHMNIRTCHQDLQAQMDVRCAAILEEIQAGRL